MPHEEQFAENLYAEVCNPRLRWELLPGAQKAIWIKTAKIAMLLVAEEAEKYVLAEGEVVKIADLQSDVAYDLSHSIPSDFTNEQGETASDWLLLKAEEINRGEYKI